MHASVRQTYVSIDAFENLAGHFGCGDCFFGAAASGCVGEDREVELFDDVPKVLAFSGFAFPA